MKRVAVIGGGPAGATAAAELAAAGVETWLYHADPAHGEKPCGGGVTSRALERFPSLGKLGIHGNPIHRVSIRSPRGIEVAVDSEPPLFTIYGRGDLDASLRERAVAAGARVRAERVESVAIGGEARVRAGGREERFDFVVGADGAFSAVRRAVVGPLEKAQLCPAVDELVEGIDPDSGAALAFFPDVTGYLWVFPRRELASVGIVARDGELAGSAMRARIREYLAERHPGARSVRSIGWAIPAPIGPRIVGPDLASERHALVGDAAGLADPLTGEGIYYALLSGTLAARAVAAGEPRRYVASLAEAVEDDLRVAARLVERYFRPRILDAMLWLASRNRRSRAILADVLSGRQRYADLSERFTGALALVGWFLKRL